MPRTRSRRSATDSRVPDGRTTLSPDRRTVTPPRPRISTSSARRSISIAVCSSTPSTAASAGSSRSMAASLRIAEVAVPGVVAAALGVVVVGDERDVQAERPEQVEPGQPARRAARLVDLVNRHGELSRGSGGRRGQHGHPVAGQDAVPQPGRDRPGPPVRERIGRAPRPGEHPVRGPDVSRLPCFVLLVFAGQRRRHPGIRVRACACRDAHLQADAVREVALRAGRDVGGVLLERVGSREHYRLRIVQAKPRHQVPVHRDHRRTGLAGPDDRQHPACRVMSHPRCGNTRAVGVTAAVQPDCRAGLDFHAAPGFRPQAAAAITVSTNSTNVMACTLVQYRQMLPMMNSSA